MKAKFCLFFLWVFFLSNTLCLSNEKCIFLETFTATKSTQISPNTDLICIMSYQTLGDAPLRWMQRLNNPPNPIQPWHVKTLDGTYWQDCGSDFYPEYLGATVSNPDCTTPLQDAFRAHLFLKKRLRAMSNSYTCSRQVHFDTAGFSDGGCDVEFDGIGRFRIVFAKGVASPCFLLASSVPQNDFWGRFVNLEIEAEVNGIAAQFGRADFGDPSNDFEIEVNVKNNSTGKSAQALVMNAFYSSPFNIVGNCGGTGTGLNAVQLNRCNMCRGFIAAGQCNTGMVFSNYTNGNGFSVDIEVLTTGIVQLDKTCAYNEIMSGVIANVTNAIDNHLGGPLRVRNVPVGATNLFANPTANDASWGGCGVVLDDTGQNPTGFSPGALPKPNVWILNKSGQSQWISFFGESTSDIFKINVRSWYDFSSPGVTIATSSPYGFILAPGEQIMYKSNGNKKYSWNWRPIVN